MKSSDIKSCLVNNPDSEVFVHIEGECYYPIKSIVHTPDNKIIIVCKDIKKVKVE